MFRTTTTQREWLLEDLEQIQRYFPGAELLEPIETPFDIEIKGKSKEVRDEGMPLCGHNDWVPSPNGNLAKNQSQSNTSSTLSSYVLTLASGSFL